MNESGFPHQETVAPSLAPQAPSSVAARPRARPLRASLAACTAEGLVAEVVGACFGSAVLTAWGMHLAASPLLLGAMWGLPYFGQVLQLPAAWVTWRFGRRRVAVITHALSRQSMLPLAALPFVHASIDAQRALLIAVFALSSVLSVVGHNAWLSWMGDLVPARVRGRYFGRRTALCTVAATAASLLVGASLDAGRARAAMGAALAAIAVTRSVAGVATTALMLRQHDPPGGSGRPALADLAAPFVDRASRRLLAFRAAWSAAIGLSASASAVYMLQALGLGFAGMAVYAAIVAGVRVVVTPLWGRALDRVGARPVLVACSFGVAISSALWLAADGRAWPIAIDALVSGLLLGGQELALFTMPLGLAPAARRPFVVAATVMIGGVAYGLASLAGGALSGSHAAVASARALFALSTCGRLVAAALALRLVEPGARSVAALARSLVGSRAADA